MERLRVVLSANPLLVDATIAVGLAALSLVALASGTRDLGVQGTVAGVLLLAQTLPLVLRRRFPVAVALLTIGATVAHLAISEGPSVRTSLGAHVAIFTVAEQRGRDVSVPVLVLAAIGLPALIIAKTLPTVPVQAVIQNILVLGAVWLLGDWSRTRHAVTEGLRAQARLRELEQAERERESLRRERERIARELHDIVSHDVSVIVIQAGGALRAIDRRPDDARTALEAIDRMGRQALADMRRMLGILGELDETLAPMPTLAQLGELLEAVRSAGLSVELALHGERRPLDPGIELSAYRIIQESLTNTLRHADGAHARVEVAYGIDELRIRITDDGGRTRGTPVEPAHDGRGLAGMRERVALFGGQLDAGRTPTGFRIAARLPLRAAEAPS